MLKCTFFVNGRSWKVQDLSGPQMEADLIGGCIRLYSLKGFEVGAEE